jgi:bacillaene synthase trans-acting acyltransferase
MSRRIAFLFSGQGSQYHQMGRGLYEHDTVFRDCMDRMDRAVQALLGQAVLPVLYGSAGKGDTFDDIRLTHPAIFMVEYALASTVMQAGLQPDLTLGSSLGTYAALAVAGGLTADEALAMVVRQALVIDRQCPRGGMVAVLSDARLFDDSPFLQARAAVAGRSFATHFVLSAPQENLEAIEAFLGRAGVAHQRLPVHYPFHAPWIEPLRDAFVQACPGDPVRPGRMPMVCCTSGGPLGSVAQDYFWQVARREMRFMDAIAGLEAGGALDYVDLSPSGTLASFLKYLLPASSSSRALSAMSPFGRDADVLANVVTQVMQGRAASPVAG